MIYLWQKIRDAVVAVKSEADFAGPHSLLNQDQGVRAVLQVTNDLCFLEADRLRLKDWGGDILSSATDVESVSTCLKSVSSQPFHTWLIDIADSLARFDWRSASFPRLTSEQELLKRAFRGSSGYLALRKEVLKHLKGLKNDVAARAERVMEILKY